MVRELILLLVIAISIASTEIAHKTRAVTAKEKDLVSNFEEEELPKDFNKSRLTSLLQTAVNEMYRKGFRYLGDHEDFDHGHILFIEQDSHSKAVAILYHTQERAYFYHGQKLGSKYDYVDCHSRNWIQWLNNPKKIENANQYERTTYPPEKEWDQYKKRVEIVYKSFFTIQPKMINPEFLGGEVVSDIQFSFSMISAQMGNKNSNVIWIEIPTGETAYLAIKNESK